MFLVTLIMFTVGSIKNQRNFLKLCHESQSVAVIMINKTAFPMRSGAFMFKGNCYSEARERVHSAPFKIRIAAIGERDSSIHFQDSEVERTLVNYFLKAGWKNIKIESNGIGNFIYLN